MLHKAASECKFLLDIVVIDYISIAKAVVACIGTCSCMAPLDTALQPNRVDV